MTCFRSTTTVTMMTQLSAPNSNPHLQQTTRISPQKTLDYSTTGKVPSSFKSNACFALLPRLCGMHKLSVFVDCFTLQGKPCQGCKSKRDIRLSTMLSRFCVLWQLPQNGPLNCGSPLDRIIPMILN